MNIDNAIEYIKLGNDKKTPKTCRFLELGLGIWVLIGVGWGYMAGNTAKIIGVIMFALYLAMLLVVIVMSVLRITQTKLLILLIKTYASWIIQLSMLETQLLVINYGMSTDLLFVHLPSILCPILIGIAENRTINANKPFFNAKKFKEIGWAYGGCLGVVGSSIAMILLEGKNQNTVVAVVLVCCMLMVMANSMGLACSILKLCYINKLKRMELCEISDFDKRF